jgi:tetratricopeptide (TPR) repeat protein
MRKIAVLMLPAFIFLSISVPSFAETSAAWGKLTPGPHAVGFQIMFRRDPSRPYKPKRDYQGNPIAGDRSRPVQISIWYPTTSGGTATQVAFQDYIYQTASEESGAEPTEAQKQNAFTAFKNQWARQASDDNIRSALATKTMAWRDAVPSKTQFPLVLIAPSSRLSSPVGIALLAEYLSSHGYVVASSPGMGLNSRQISFNSVGTITQMQDMQFILATLHSFPAVDPDKLAVIGFSFGGLAGSLLSMYNGDVDAFVSLETAAANNYGYSVLFQNPLYDPSLLRVPVLHFTAQELNEASNDSFLRAIKYAPLTQIKLKGMTPGDFSSFGMIVPMIPVPPPSEGEPRADNRSGYETICRYTAQFLNARVKKDPQADAFLKQSPEQNGLPAGVAILETRPGLKIPPSEEEFVKILREKGLPAAAAIHKETRDKDPDYDIYEPDTLVAIASEYSEQKKTKEAIDLLTFNAEVYPNDSGTYELLGTIYMNEGKKDLAIEHFEKVLEFDPANQNAAEMLKKLKS